VRRWRGRVIVASTLALSLLLGSWAEGTSRLIGSDFVQYRVPTPGANPYGVAVGVDGRVWFVESDADKVGAVDRRGNFEEWPLDFFEGSGPRDLTLGPSGDLWFTETNVDLIGRITPEGAVSHYPVPVGFSRPLGIAAAPDGTIWFAMNSEVSELGILFPPLGYIEEVVLPPTVWPAYIAAGPDGNLWFTGQLGNVIGRISPVDRTFVLFPVPTENSLPWNIAAGPDGNMWFTSLAGHSIGRVTMSGQITEFPIPDGFGNVGAIAPGFDGHMWFVQSDASLMGAISTDGEFLGSIRTGTYPTEVVAGADGGMWISERFESNAMARLDIEVGDASVVSTDAGFIRRVVSVPLGGEVRWLFQGAREHSVTDTLGLFDTGPRPVGSLEAFVYQFAGSFPYRDRHDRTLRGRVEVPIEVPPAAEIGMPFTVTWAAGPPPPGHVFDVQVRLPGATGWESWQEGVTTLSADYTATEAGPHSFRAAIRAPAGTRSGWSPAGTVEVG
jgi:streptogramin lyase